MSYLLLGPDDFSKKVFVQNLVQKLGASLEVFRNADELPKLTDLLQTDLFSKPKVFWFNGILPEFSKGVPDFTASTNHVVVSVESLDKRKKENKDLLANKVFEVKEFPLPHGRGLNDWLTERVRFYHGSIAASAVEALAIALGRDDAKETKFGGKVVEVREVYNLWQADSEIQKLIAYTSGKEITEADVRVMCEKNGEVDVFDLTNAIADNQKQIALSLLHQFLKNQAGADEKGAIIQLNALLSEQFRNVAAVHDFSSRKTPEVDILEATSWKSGRLFVIRKIAARFKPKTVLELLNKLQALDEELKTSQIPPKVLLDLIISQLLV